MHRQTKKKSGITILIRQSISQNNKELNKKKSLVLCRVNPNFSLSKTQKCLSVSFWIPEIYVNRG